MSANADRSLHGRTALITGGSRGIGLGIARRFVEAGANVVIVARRPDVLEAAKAELDALAPAKTVALTCDVAGAPQIDRLGEQLRAQKREIDILVNNAGTSQRSPFEAAGDEMWQSDLDLKLFAAIRLCRLVLPGMKAQRWGRIINVVSIQGKAPGAGSAPTSVSRAAGIALTKVMATEFAPFNVLVNALCTGTILSDQTRRGYEPLAGKMSFEEYLAERAKTIPLGRVGSAEEYANVALFLASEAGSYVTGTAINVDGGLSQVP